MALLSKQNETYLMYAAGAGLVIVTIGAVLAAQKAAQIGGDIIDAGVDFVTEDLNPTSEYNLVNQSIGAPVNDAVSSVTGRGLGGTLFCFFNSQSPACNEALFDYATKRNLPYFDDTGKSIHTGTLASFEAWQSAEHNYNSGEEIY